MRKKHIGLSLKKYRSEGSEVKPEVIAGSIERAVLGKADSYPFRVAGSRLDLGRICTYLRIR